MSALALKEIASPGLMPGEDIIDLDHLSRMTLGERSLELEVLMLFVTGLLFFVARLLEEAQRVAEDNEQIV